MDVQPVEPLRDTTPAGPSTELQRSVDALFPPHWRGKLLDTRTLGAKLQVQASSEGTSDVSGPFFEELRQQIQRISKTFNKAASKVSRAAKFLPSDGKQVSIWFWSKWRAFKVAGTDTVIPLTSSSVTEEAAWCYIYARVNKAILERILQQHDLTVGSNDGKAFFKDAHCVGEFNILSSPSFLHSPWLEELLALQSRVSQQTNDREAKRLRRARKRELRLQGTAGSIPEAQAARQGLPHDAPDPKCHLTADADVADTGRFADGDSIELAPQHQPSAASRPKTDSHAIQLQTGDREHTDQMHHVADEALSAGSPVSRPQTADSIPSTGSIPPGSVQAELEASRHRKLAGPLLPVDIGEGVPARKKLLRKQSEPYIPRRACLQEVCQRLHVSHDVADPLCRDDDLVCSVCLDYFCQPVGLACGHVFCMSCLVDAMKGSVLLRPQVLPRTGRCPECRQANVCRTCVELRELDKLVQLRHPKEYRAKLAEWEWRVHIALQGRFVYGRASMISAFPMAMPL